MKILEERVKPKVEDCFAWENGEENGFPFSRIRSFEV